MGEVEQRGVTDGDPSGTVAHEAAQAWAAAHGHPYPGWKHVVDRTEAKGDANVLARGTDRTVARPKVLLEAAREAWIETTSVMTHRRSEWRVLVAGEVIEKGEVPGDSSGVAAYEAALRWLALVTLPFGGWTHAADRTPGAGPDDAPSYGWVNCITGSREPVVVTVAQLRELLTGALPCPSVATRARPSSRRATTFDGSRWPGTGRAGTAASIARGDPGRVARHPGGRTAPRADRSRDGDRYHRSLGPPLDAPRAHGTRRRPGPRDVQRIPLRDRPQSH
ncbi:MAG: hypothetical protein M3680_06100 [Myxococcota bacterium]|nr:hypothetical protein [Myxococcota bacterium]